MCFDEEEMPMWRHWVGPELVRRIEQWGAFYADHVDAETLALPSADGIVLERDATELLAALTEKLGHFFRFERGADFREAKFLRLDQA